MSTARRSRILAVDDDSDLLALMAKALGTDYEADTAADGGTAIEKAFADLSRDDIRELEQQLKRIGRQAESLLDQRIAKRRSVTGRV